ncbi:MAG: hypothetical protein ACR2KW_02575 [Rubrobacter sp.]
MVFDIYRRIFPARNGLRRGSGKLIEQGSFRGRSRRSSVLVRVYDHVRYFLVLRGPDLDPATRQGLRRAQDDIEHELGCIPLPLEGVGPSEAASGHLANAKALCDEHLAGTFPLREARVRRSIGRAYRDECDPLCGSAPSSRERF